jgi:type I restriction enzyme S subunit
VPLISSTGHGDAALHRVHYQDGKFALANLLVALIPTDPSVCDTKYLYHLLMARKDELFVPLMQGTANVSLKEKDIAKVEISLPSLNEQKRLVSLIEEAGSLVQEAQRCRVEALEAGNELLRAILTQDNHSVPTPMGELVRLRALDVIVDGSSIYEFAGVYCFGRGVFRSGRKSGLEFAYPRLTTVRAGDFVYPKLMAWEGALAVVPPDCDGCVVSPEFPVFEIDKSRVFPEVLDVYFRNPSMWPQLSEASTGTNVRRRRLNPQDFLAYKMPLPSRATQLKLRTAYAEVAKLKELQSQTAAELDALMPSVLSKAFAGAL